MGELALILAEKMVKSIVSYLMDDERIIDSDDIASLCSAIYKHSDPVSELRMKNSLEQAQLELCNGIEAILTNSSLSAQQQDVLKDAIIDTINRSDLSSSNLTQLHNDSNKLFGKLVENCAELKMFSQKEEDYIKRCLRFVSSGIICTISSYATDFSAMNYKQILDEMENVKEVIALNTADIIKSLQPRDSDTVSGFYSEYTQAIKRNYSYIELFTSKIDAGFAKSYRLDLAYIELFLKLQDDNKSFAMSVPQLLNQGHRWLVTGEAGCGKTTLLQWISLAIASGAPKDVNLEMLDGFFPVLITLRKVKEWYKFGLKQAIEEEFHDSDLRAPMKLINELRGTGKKLILMVDGLDEIDEEKRSKLYKWIFALSNERDEWVRKENETKLLKKREKDKGAQLSDREKVKNELIIIFTSRPIISSAAISELKKDINVRTAYVQPMTYMDVQRFVDYWHNAIAYGRNFNEDILADKARLLKSRIGSQESLSRLAQNPLLCAMICALHYKKEGILPTNKLELYDSCSRMLLEERDTLRKVYTEKYRELLLLEFEDKRRILSDLALWMLESEGALLVDFSSAVNRLKSKLSFMQKINGLNEKEAERQAELILDYFIERGGILRWIDNGKIGFIHKTFQEYFAAYQIYLGEEWAKIISPSKALDVIWRETIILSVSFSNLYSAEKVIGTFLCRSGDRESEIIEEDQIASNRIVYRILAINCAAAARELQPQTKAEIDACTKLLIPPTSPEIGKALSSCGNLVVPLLAYNADIHKSFITACARVLLEIRTRQSLAQMINYLDSRSKEAYSTLFLYWNYLSKDLLVESGIVPAYIEATFEHSINCKNKGVVLGKVAIHRLARIAICCSLKFEKQPNTYVLSDCMRGRLNRRMSRIEALNIQNNAFKEPLPNEAVLKILDLFSISAKIKRILVSYEYEATEIQKFCCVISQFANLSSLVVYDVPHSLRADLENGLRKLNIPDLQIKEIKDQIK